MNFKINKKSFLILFFSVFLFLNFLNISQAQVFGEPPPGQVINIEQLLFAMLIFVVWPITVTLVIIFFVMAGFKFLTAKGNPEQLETARRFLIWAVGGVIVIILAFSIVTILQTTFFPPVPEP